MAVPLLARQYAENVDVERRDEVPDRFVWRDRLHVVRAILDHWVIAGEWWASREGVAGLDDEHEFWRVEAQAGRSGSVAVVDLCFSWASGRWTLRRVFD